MMSHQCEHLQSPEARDGLRGLHDRKGSSVSPLFSEVLETTSECPAARNAGLPLSSRVVVEANQFVVGLGRRSRGVKGATALAMASLASSGALPH